MLSPGLNRTRRIQHLRLRYFSSLLQPSDLQEEVLLGSLVFICTEVPVKDFFFLRQNSADLLLKRHDIILVS